MRKVPANEIRRRLRVSTNTNVSNQTVRNRLRGTGLRARRPLRRPRLTQAHRAARRVWAGQHRRWTRQDWANVLFTDEFRFLLEPDDRRIHVWRRHGERFTDNCIQERAAYGSGSMRVWGGMSLNDRTPLYHLAGNLNAVRYRDEILQPLVTPAIQLIGPNAILQDDNARPHRARVGNTFLQQAGINRMPWPANSPDMNPIEHL